MSIPEGAACQFLKVRNAISLRCGRQKVKSHDDVNHRALTNIMEHLADS